MTDFSETGSTAHTGPGFLSLKHIGSGLCIILFPIMLIFGFVTHPSIFSVSMVTDYTEWRSEWRTSDKFRLGHLLIMFAVPLVIAACIRFISLIQGPDAWYRFITIGLREMQGALT